MIDQPNVSEGILSFARSLSPDLLLLHWKGQPSRGRYLLGRTLDPVIQYAPCDVAVIRAEQSSSDSSAKIADLNRVLVPSGGGPNASLALQIAVDLGEQVQVTALRVANKNLGPTAISSQWQILRSVLQPWMDQERIHARVGLASNPLTGMLEEAEREYDLVLIGATRESFVDRLLFGNLPQELAMGTTVPLVIVRRHDPTAGAALRRARWRLLSLLPQLTLEERLGIYQQVRRGSRADTDFYVMMILAAAIASFGLLLNSPAVIIGAMLVAPLMSALVGVGLGIVQGDSLLVRLSLRTTTLGVLIVLGVSAVAGLVMPGERATSEMLGRSTPTLLDLAVALVSGAAAAYAIARRDVASALPGVAIAVALVPPLATVGISVVMGFHQMAGGAALLFITNLAAIISAVAVMYLWMGFHPDIGEEIRARTFRGGLAGTALMLLAITAILATLTVSSVRRGFMREAIRVVLTEELRAMDGSPNLTNWTMNQTARAGVELEVSVQTAGELSPRQISVMQDKLEGRLGRPVSITVIVTQVKRMPGMPTEKTEPPEATGTPVPARAP